MIIRLAFISLVFLTSMNLNGQNALQFSFECGEEIKSSIASSALLKNSNGNISELYSDTLTKFDFFGKDYFTSKGKHTLSIHFNAEKYGQGSIDYDFELNGNEIKTIISVDFDFREQLHKKGDIYEKGEKILNGYIRVTKYYETPKSVEITLDKENKGSEFYKGPFFEIKNNSKDTLYGEHLPGYFWGTLSYLRNDSVYVSRTGMLDYQFVNSPPLYPDSVKTATVGSFGLTKKLYPFDYRFEVMLAEKWQSMGIGIYEKHKGFVWWAGTKDYYKLIYDFKVE